MRIEFHTWTPRHYMCFFLIKKRRASGVRERASAAPLGQKKKKKKKKKEIGRGFSHFSSHSRFLKLSCVPGVPWGSWRGHLACQSEHFRTFPTIRLSAGLFQKLALGFVASLPVPYCGTNSPTVTGIKCEQLTFSANHRWVQICTLAGLHTALTYSHYR